MQIEEGARIVVEDWLRIKKGNKVIFIVDETQQKEALAFQKAIKKLELIVRLLN